MKMPKLVPALSLLAACALAVSACTDDTPSQTVTETVTVQPTDDPTTEDVTEDPTTEEVTETPDEATDDATDPEGDDNAGGEASMVLASGAEAAEQLGYECEEHEPEQQEVAWTECRNDAGHIIDLVEYESPEVRGRHMGDWGDRARRPIMKHYLIVSDRGQDMDPIAERMLEVIR